MTGGIVLGMALLLGGCQSTAVRVRAMDQAGHRVSAGPSSDRDVARVFALDEFSSERAPLVTATAESTQPR